MGPPNAGKGTQAQKLQENLGIPKLSMGDILRRNICLKTDGGIKAKEQMDKGSLVSDEIVIDILKNRILQEDCGRGFILDGFPRTEKQAQALDKILKDNNLIIDKVLCLTVDPEKIVERQAGRRVALKSGCVYHLEHNPPKIPGKCDVSGEDLIQREDDKEDVVRHRLKIYKDKVLPIIDYYDKKDLLYKIKGDDEINKVTASIMSVIETK